MKRLQPHHTLSLESIQKEFETWRANRSKREPIPEPLWEGALQLCEHLPVSRVSRVLHLSFVALKKRLTGPLPVKFTELNFSDLSGSWQIECQRPDGTQLRVSSSGQPLPLEVLLREFLS